MLLEHGADPDEKMLKGETPPIYWAVQENHRLCVQLLIRHGCDINRCDDTGHNSLYLAAADGNIEMVKLLLHFGADVNCLPDTSAFSIACAYEHYSVCDLLLQVGADINHQDVDGRTSLHFAVIRQNREMIAYLIAHGANKQIIDNDGISATTLLKNEELRQKLYEDLFGDQYDVTN